MSTNYKPYPGLEGKLSLTQFSGGERGMCLQITGDSSRNFIQVTRGEAAALKNALRDWLAGDSSELKPE